MALPAELAELAAEVSNWGRWGDDDERGTLNLIDAAALRRGADAVQRGQSFSLAMPLDQHGPQTGSIPGRLNPLRTMLTVNTPYTGDPSDLCANDDVVTMGLQSCTHWDALAHVSYDGRLYNGFDAATVSAAGAARCGIDKAGPVVSRGVLLDVPRAIGQTVLEPGHAISAMELDAAERNGGTAVQPGDIVLVRTGHVTLWKTKRRRAYTEGSCPGLSTSTIGWLRARDVAAVATDTLVLEVWPCEDPKVLLPVHMIQLRDMGLLQGQNFDLEALADDCAADGRHEFLLSATPEPFTGGAGAPVAPVATK
ncbi:cyclase family protein [soil metagenome]